MVVATLGGQYGAAAKNSKWNTLRAGITLWLSLSSATGIDAFPFSQLTSRLAIELPLHLLDLIYVNRVCVLVISMCLS